MTRCKKTDLLFFNLYIHIFLNMEKKSYTYILFSQRNGTLYVGVTSNLKNRIIEHKEKHFPGFTSRYGVDKLGYFEEYNDIRLAIQREKELKGWNRNKKISLIESSNPHWNDLFYELQ
jgi:putative endonuclease